MVGLVGMPWGRSDKADILLVEAKAHRRDLFVTNRGDFRFTKKNQSGTKKDRALSTGNATRAMD
jgi:hypothetical protein